MNFALILFLLLVVTFVAWLFERFVLAPARGRYIVGMPPGGTLGQTIGDDLDPGENRPVGEHNHAVDPHNHDIAPHAHGVTDTGHTHEVGVDDPGHTHDVWVTEYNNYYGGSVDWGEGHGDGAWYTTPSRTTGISVVITSTTANISEDNVPLTTNDTDLTVDNGGNIANTTTPGTNAPYIQLLVCQKNP